MKHTTEYLYGVSPLEFETMPYKKALEYKITQAKSLLLSLIEEHWSIRDDERLNSIFSAIKFNEALLHELQSHK